jgi:hypothetical protein
MSSFLFASYMNSALLLSRCLLFVIPEGFGRVAMVGDYSQEKDRAGEGVRHKKIYT